MVTCNGAQHFAKGPVAERAALLLIKGLVEVGRPAANGQPVRWPGMGHLIHNEDALVGEARFPKADGNSYFRTAGRKCKAHVRV